jgi:hypothetical protein
VYSVDLTPALVIILPNRWSDIPMEEYKELHFFLNSDILNSERYREV